jgi:chemotaxis protein methyltransferase CheR
VSPPTLPDLRLEQQREFAFSLDDFHALRDLVKRFAGISLGDSKQELVYGRISRRLRALRLRSFREYRALLASREGQQEIVEFCNAITTNLTSFFRERHHFDYLRAQLLLPRAAAGGSRRLRIWCAACSTGEEAYSIAMTVIESLPDWQRWDIRILATDLDSEVLGRARAGLYKSERLAGMTPQRLGRCFERAGADEFQVRPELRSLVAFKQLNLMHALPLKGPLDAIFCRNVIIYFDKQTQCELFRRLAPLQRPDDLLFLGHSESLFKVSDSWQLIGRTVYRKVVE